MHGFCAERGNCTHQYMLEPILLSSTRIIASVQLSSHALRCESGHRGTSDESGRLCTHCLKQVREYEVSHFDTVLSLDHAFHTSSTHAQSLHEFLSQPHRATLDCKQSSGRVLEHRESLLTVTKYHDAKCNISGLMGHI